MQAGDQHRPPQPNLLPQAIGRKTPDKRNRSPSAMARPASRKAVSSLPAIANIDEQLDEVVMSKKDLDAALVAELATRIREDMRNGFFYGLSKQAVASIVDRLEYAIGFRDEAATAYDKACEMYPGSPSQRQAFMAGVVWKRDNPEKE